MRLGTKWLCGLLAVATAGNAAAECAIDWQVPPAGTSTGLCVLAVADVDGRSRLRPIADGFAGLGVTVAWLKCAEGKTASSAEVARALKEVRSEAGERGFPPGRIGAVCMGAGADAVLRLADAPDRPLFAVALAPTSVPEAWSSNACPVCFIQGALGYDPLAMTRAYWGLRRAGVPAEVHAYGDRPCDSVGEFARIREFLNHMGFLGKLPPPVHINVQYASDDDRASCEKFPVWPEGRMPDAVTNQCVPYLEWHFPKKLTTKAIQIVFSGGGYIGNDPDNWEVAPARRYLNAKGMTVVTLKYRTPGRVDSLPKHLRAWQDLQRTVRLVRSRAPSLGLDPDRIGVWGGSAGGHLALMGAASSLHRTYRPIDAADNLSCSIQWAVAIYPAYILDDGEDEAKNTTHGNDPSVRMLPDFDFDRATCPVVFLHGDADVVSSMGSVRFWERLHGIGVLSELHTYAKLTHCFFINGYAGTACISHMDQIWEFMGSSGLNR